ncbi:hypothetical protein VVR46_12790, partial [Corynebacterium phoceense]|uniref:hypothetical protein n=1 Tax=Corynebacterium phoceense TaxID=1686286 RepID=UPI0034CFB953
LNPGRFIRLGANNFTTSAFITFQDHLCSLTSPKTVVLRFGINPVAKSPLAHCLQQRKRDAPVADRVAK